MSLEEEGKVLALIPARGGSKGIHRKNLVELGGTPLIGWSIESALACPEIDQVVVSTDDPEIAQVSESMGASCPGLRPKSLASDTALLRDVVDHTIEQVFEDSGDTFSRVMVLLPSHPFRSAELLGATIRACTGDITHVSTAREFIWNDGDWIGKRGNEWKPVLTGTNFPQPAFHKFNLANCTRLNASRSSLSTELDTPALKRFRPLLETLHFAEQDCFRSTRYLFLANGPWFIDIDTESDLEMARDFLETGSLPDLESKQLNTWCGFSYGELGFSTVFFLPDLANELEVTHGDLPCTVTSQKLTVEFTSEPIENDLIIINFFALDAALPVQSLRRRFTQGSSALTLEIPIQAAAATVHWVRPGYPPPGERSYWEPLDLPGWMTFDRNEQAWRNEISGAIISGRQQLPEIQSRTGIVR